VEEGAVGAGTGMISFDWKAGIGTSSRRAGPATVGVLVLANFGVRDQLTIAGVPVGRLLGAADAGRGPAGSCIAVVATDAPLPAADLTRLARRAGLGLARTGSVAHHGSGEIFLAFSTGSGGPGDLDELFQATVDATEEAVLNALWAAEDTVGRDGRLVRALPHDDVLALLRDRVV
jgi:D-aminopeptidase